MVSATLYSPEVMAIACPHCGAAASQRCKNSSTSISRIIGPHAKRLKAAGVKGKVPDAKG